MKKWKIWKTWKRPKSWFTSLRLRENCINRLAEVDQTIKKCQVDITSNWSENLERKIAVGKCRLTSKTFWNIIQTKYPPPAMTSLKLLKLVTIKLKPCLDLFIFFEILVAFFSDHDTSDNNVTQVVTKE